MEILKLHKVNITKINLTHLLYGICLAFTIILFMSTSGDLFKIALALSALVPEVFVLVRTHGKVKLPMYFIVLSVAILVCFIISIYCTKYSQFYTLTCYAVLFALFITENNTLKFGDVSLQNKFGWFGIIMWVIIIYDVYICKTNNAMSIVLHSISDPNYTGVLIYLMFLFSNKLGDKLGIFLGLCYVLLFNNSRSVLLLFVLFYLIKFLKPVVSAVLNKLKKFNVFGIFIILFIAVAILSYVWVYVISANSFTAHKESLNDNSNRVRFLANLKSYEVLNDKNMLLYGSGDDIYEFLGITFGNEITLLKYGGMRLVQAHNSLINPLIRMGIIPGTIYLYVLSKLLDKFWTDDNLEYLFPYILNAMFMHSLFNLQWLILWVLILMLPKNKTKVRIFNVKKKLSNNVTDYI